MTFLERVLPRRFAAASEVERLRLGVFVFFGTVTTAALFGFSAYHLSVGAVDRGVETLVSAVFMLAMYGAVRVGADLRMVFRLSLLACLAFMTTMMLEPGPSGSRLLWVYVFPVAAYFLTGPREGLVLSTLAVVLLGISFNPWGGLPLDTPHFDPAFKARMLLSLVMVVGGSHVIALMHARYRSALEQTRREQEQLLAKLKATLDEVKTLSGLLPICSHCKSIRDDAGQWVAMDTYLASHSEAKVSHGICPTCIKNQYPGMFSEEELQRIGREP